MRIVTCHRGHIAAWHGFLRATLVSDNTVFPKYDVLGWYSTGADVLPSDTAIHDKARACRLSRNLSMRRNCARRSGHRVPFAAGCLDAA